MTTRKQLELALLDEKAVSVARALEISNLRLQLTERNETVARLRAQVQRWTENWEAAREENARFRAHIRDLIKDLEEWGSHASGKSFASREGIEDVVANHRARFEEREP